jgi:tetratricopeptide (TPR) repeat protein
LQNNRKTMKKVIILLLSSIFWLGAVEISKAQNSAVTNTHFALQEAREYMANGQIDKAVGKIESARQNIDAASSHEKTGKNPKTWKYRGDVYREFLSLPEVKLSVKHMEAARASIESYDKAIQLDQSKRGDYKKPSQNGKNQIYPLLFNQGIESINQKDYDKALESFDLVLMINPKDTNATLNAGLAAERKPDPEKAVEYYEKMIYQQGAIDHYPFIRVAEYYSEKEDYDKALEVIHKGLASATNKEGIKDLQTTEFNIYLRSGRLQEAVDNLKEAIETDPENDGNYSRLGQLLDQNGESEEALKNYEKAVELNPDNIDANYNLGAFYYNRGAEKLQATRDMDLKTYKSKGVAMEKDAVEDLKIAKPYFEKVNKIQPDDAAVLNSLETIDSILKTKEN